MAGEKKFWLGLVILAVVATLSVVLVLRYWFTGVMPTLGKLPELSTAAILSFAFLAGMASFLAPCAVPFFPAYITYYLNVPIKRGRILHGALLGLVGGLGIITLLAIVGVVLATLGKAVSPFLVWFKPFLALFIFVLGFLLWKGFAVKVPGLSKLVHFVKPGEDHPHSVARMYGFGALYGAATLGCTLPLLMALAIVPLLKGEFAFGLVSFLVYGAGLAMSFLIATILLTLFKKQFTHFLVRHAVTVKKGSGIALMLIGLLLLAYFVIFRM